MDEAEWLVSFHFQKLYSELKRRHRAAQTKAGRRKLRLLACGMCRTLLWHLPLPEAHRRVLEAAEDHADERITDQDLMATVRSCPYVQYRRDGSEADRVNTAVHAIRAMAQCRAAVVVYQVNWRVGDAIPETERPEARRTMCVLLRDVFGNPFRPLVIDPVVLARDGGQVKRVAASIYDERAFDQLPVLADALEDADCSDASLLAHLRDPGPHVRGCFALDAVLGKNAWVR